MRPEQGTMQSRAQAMAAILELLSDEPVIICNGFPSREAFKIADRPTHFYMIGSMGVAAAIGLGVALSKPAKRVVVFDGDGNARLLDVMASAWHIIEGITFRNSDVAIFAGQKEVAGAIGLTVRNCRFESVGFGVWTEYAGSREFYIADNLFLGRDDRFRLIGWTGPPSAPGAIRPASGPRARTSPARPALSPRCVPPGR